MVDATIELLVLRLPSPSLTSAQHTHTRTRGQLPPLDGERSGRGGTGGDRRGECGRLVAHLLLQRGALALKLGLPM